MNELPLQSVNEIVFQLAPIIRTFGDHPYFFFGHSFGAILAFELARELHANNSLRGLIVSSCAAPHIQSKRKKNLSMLPKTEFFSEIQKLNGIPEEFKQNSKLLELIEPSLRADIQCREQWHLNEDFQKLHTPIYPVGGNSDPYVTATDLEAWKRYTREPKTVDLFCGGHFYIEQSMDILEKISCLCSAVTTAI